MRFLDPLSGGTYDRMERWTTALATGGFGSSGRNAGRGIESSGHRACQRMDVGQTARTKTHDRVYPHLRGLFRGEGGEDRRVQLVVVALASLYT